MPSNGCLKKIIESAVIKMKKRLCKIVETAEGGGNPLGACKNLDKQQNLAYPS
jgi:hypothetical protein